MRYSKEHKQETHARIVKKASVRLREKGAHGIGVADLMKDAGLTHGGFYAHFDSREALVIEAFALRDGPLDRALAQARRTDAARKTPRHNRGFLSDADRIVTIPAMAAPFRRSARRSPARARKPAKPSRPSWNR